MSGRKALSAGTSSVTDERNGHVRHVAAGDGRAGGTEADGAAGSGGDLLPHTRAGWAPPRSPSWPLYEWGTGPKLGQLQIQDLPPGP